jgi:AcrR family transcriptional regulator
MPAARTRRGSYAKSAETQATIARAALAVVREKGHRALTTSEVSQRAGVSEATRFYHFPTRDHLLVAAMELVDDEARARYFDPEASDIDLDQIPWLMARAGMENDKTLHLFTALQAEAPNPHHPAHAYFTEHYERATGALAGMLRRRQAEGLAVPELDPDTVSRQLLGVWGGLQSQWLVNPSFDLADEIRQAFRRLTGQAAMETKQAIDDLMTRV